MTETPWTPGKWKREALGGFSVVICEQPPRRSDTRIPPYGYSTGRGFSLGYPFLEDNGEARRDFVCFSHGDALLISKAPEMAELLAELRDYFDQRADAEYFTDSPRPVANDEMRHLSEIDELLQLINGAGQ